MSKAMMIVDYKDECQDCEGFLGLDRKGEIVCIPNDRRVKEFYTGGGKPSWCPMQKLPERKPEKTFVGAHGIREEAALNDAFSEGFNRGWNALLDKIEEEEKKEGD